MTDVAEGNKQNGFEARVCCTEQPTDNIHFLGAIQRVGGVRTVEQHTQLVFPLVLRQLGSSGGGDMWHIRHIEKMVCFACFGTRGRTRVHGWTRSDLKGIEKNNKMQVQPPSQYPLNKPFRCCAVEQAVSV